MDALPSYVVLATKDVPSYKLKPFDDSDCTSVNSGIEGHREPCSVIGVDMSDDHLLP